MEQVPSVTRAFKERRNEDEEAAMQVPSGLDPAAKGFMKAVLMRVKRLEASNRIYRKALLDHSKRLRTIEYFHDKDFKLGKGQFVVTEPGDEEISEGNGE